MQINIQIEESTYLLSICYLTCNTLQLLLFLQKFNIFLLKASLKEEKFGKVLKKVSRITLPW